MLILSHRELRDSVYLVISNCTLATQRSDIFPSDIGLNFLNIKVFLSVELDSVRLYLKYLCNNYDSPSHN